MIFYYLCRKNVPRMKKYLTLLAAVWLLAGCAEPPKTEGDTLCVSILPLRSIVEGIVGEDFPIEVLVPAGASPETFEPTPRQFVELNRARMIFSVGLIDFEQSLLQKLEERDKVVPLSRGIELLAGSCAHMHGNDGEHGHAHGIDPHVWTSPRALSIMARNAYEAIHAAWPDSTKYTLNHERLQEQLRELDRRTAAKIGKSGVDYFIIYHPALTYYARDYGIRQEAIEADGQGALGTPAHGAYPPGSPRRDTQDLLPEPVPGIGRRGHRPRHRCRLCGDRSSSGGCDRQHRCNHRFDRPAMTLVSLHHVSVAYDGCEALRDVDLQIDDRDFLGVIGPNGGGKTTLVKAILGTVPYTGEIVLSPELFRGEERLIGYMPQLSEFDRAFPISILEIVLSGLQGRRGFRSRYTKADRNKALGLLEASGIAETARHPVGEVSGGQLQRALLCRAVISDPKLLILDEPTNFVDNRFEKELYNTLRTLNDRMAIVVVSHDIGTITSVVKEIVCVNRRVHRHRSNILTEEQLRNYDCPIQLLSHGHIPHTVLEHHPGDGCCDEE